MTTFQHVYSCIIKPCIISGDFNINLLNYLNSSSQSFIDLLTTLSFLPLIDKPTRITDSSATLIHVDNIFCNILPCPKSGILLSDITDHLPICMYTQSPNSNVSNNINCTPFCNRNFSKCNLQRFNEDLLSLNWDDVFCCDNPEVAFNTFMDRFNYFYDKDIPLKFQKHNSSRKNVSNTPWITSALIKSINKKN